MTSVSADHIILTQTQPGGSGWPQRGEVFPSIQGLCDLDECYQALSERQINLLHRYGCKDRIIVPRNYSQITFSTGGGGGVFNNRDRL